MWLPLALKMAITVVLIAPLGFVMGMPFPTGLKRLEEWHAPRCRWAWSSECGVQRAGLGGRAGVRRSTWGWSQTLIIGGLFYLAALAVVARVRPDGARRRSRARAAWCWRGNPYDTDCPCSDGSHPARF